MNDPIRKYHDNDILMGRGGKNNQHVGNEQLRVFARERSEKYRLSSKKGKSYISREIVQIVRNLEPPGRFLKKNVATGTWEDVGDEIAREKASQALRDAVSVLPQNSPTDGSQEGVAQQQQHNQHQPLSQPAHLEHQHEEPRSRKEQYQERRAEPVTMNQPPPPTYSSPHPYPTVTPASPSSAAKRPRHYEQSTPYQQQYHHHHYYEQPRQYEHRPPPPYDYNRQYQPQQQQHHFPVPSSPIQVATDPSPYNNRRPPYTYPTYRPSSHQYPMHHMYPPRHQPIPYNRNAPVDSPGGILGEIPVTDFDLFNGELLEDEVKGPSSRREGPAREGPPPAESPPISSDDVARRHYEAPRRQHESTLVDSPASHDVARYEGPRRDDPRQTDSAPFYEKGGRSTQR